MKKVKFLSEGLSLAGNLYRPANFDATQTYAAVIISGSWTTVKEQMAHLYAQQFSAMNFAAFTFDHRNFGESEGLPREYENPEMKVADIKNAVTYLSALPFVDTDKISGLGICAGGAYMIHAAAEDSRIKLVATVAAWLMTPETAKLIYGGAEGVALRITKALEAKEVFAETGKSISVPAYDPNNQEAARYFPVDYYGKSERGAVPSWKNNFAVMSWEKWLSYDGVSASKSLSVPVVMIASEQQFLPTGTKTAFENFSSDAKAIEWLNDYGHTDFYDDAHAISEAISLIVDRFHVVLQEV